MRHGRRQWPIGRRPRGSCGVDLAAPGRLTCASVLALDRRLAFYAVPGVGETMRRRVMMVLAGVAVCCAPLAISGVADAGAAPAVAGAVRTGGWGRAIEVPGSGALNKGGDVDLNSVSCASAGNCAAGGFYTDGSGNEQALVVSERKGVWGRAMEVPGSAALNKGGFANPMSVSCASAGNCAAGGFYTDGSGNEQALVVSERKGVWGRAMEVPGSGALNKGGDARVNSVSCPSAGNCAAGGNYFDGSGHRQGFVVNRS